MSGVLTELKFAATFLVLLLTVAVNSSSVLAQGAKLQGFWHLYAILENGSSVDLTTVTSRPEYTGMTFGKGNYRFDGICNRALGKYTLKKGGKIKFISTRSTAMSCGKERNRAEISFFRVLKTTTTYRVESNRLTLEDNSGKNKLIFSRK